MSKKCTGPANGFPLHKFRNNKKMHLCIIFFKSKKKIKSPEMSFYYVNVETIFILFYLAQGALNTEGMDLHYCSPIQKRNRIVLNY